MSVSASLDQSHAFDDARVARTDGGHLHAGLSREVARELIESGPGSCCRTNSTFILI